MNEIHCRNALTKSKGRFPYDYELNPYRGCAHHCQYCYAMYTHRYLEDDGHFFDHVHVKSNIVEALRSQLTAPSWKHKIIGIGTVCDAYQPIEAEMKLMPEILKLLIETATPCVISTKSALILRDKALLDELAEKVPVIVAFSINTVDEELRKIMEPNATPIQGRIMALRAFRNSKVKTGLHTIPIIPMLTDSRENLEALLQLAHEADYFTCGTMYLRGETRKAFMAFIERQYPHLKRTFMQLYAKGSLDKEYKKQLYSWLRPRMKDINTDYQQFLIMNEQLSLF